MSFFCNADIIHYRRYESEYMAVSQLEVNVSSIKTQSNTVRQNCIITPINRRLLCSRSLMVNLANFTLLCN